MEDFVWHNDSMRCHYYGEDVAISRTLREGKDQSEAHSVDVPGLIGCKRTLECAKKEVTCVRALIDHPERFTSYETIEPGVFKDYLFEKPGESGATNVGATAQNEENGDEIHPKFT